MKAIRRLREKAGQTQFTVALKSGVPRMRLSLAESGQLRLRPEEEEAVRRTIREGIEQQAAQLQQLLSGKQMKVEHSSQQQDPEQRIGA